MSVLRSSSLALLLACPIAVKAQTASQALDSSWVQLCSGASPGTPLFDRCQEILNAGPGSGGRRSAAAIGNNLEIFASQGRIMLAMARNRARAAARASDKQADGEHLVANWAGDPVDDSQSLAEGSRWSLFGSFSHASADRHDTGFERGYGDTGQTYLLGLDYRWNEHWTGLVALQRDSHRLDFQRRSGGMHSDTDLLSATLAYGRESGFYASLGLNWGRTDSSLRREIDYTLVLDAGLPTERSISIHSEGDSRSHATVRGADLNLGWERSSGAWRWRVGGGLGWQKTELDRIAEDNPVGLDFLILAQQVDSRQASLEFEVARTISASSGVWQPYARVGWRHEFADDPRRIFAAFRGGDRIFRISFLSGEPDRDSGEVGLGVVGVFRHGWQAYAGWQRTVGNSLMDEDRFDVGWRREF